MTKEWFLLIDSTEEGPYDLDNLKRDYRITPDTLVRKTEWTFWKRICDVEELQELFPEEEPAPPPIAEEEGLPAASLDLALALKRDPPQLLIWMIVIFLLILYFIWVWN